MPQHLPSPPELPGYTWRAARPEDAPAIARLADACSVKPQAFNPIGGAPPENTLLAGGEDGELAALALVYHDDVIKHEHRILLEGMTHPAQAGLGDFLLDWMEARGSEVAATLSNDRPRILRVDVIGERPQLESLLVRHGLKLSLSEYLMRRDLSEPIPAAPLPAGMTAIEYRPELAHTFYDTYADAFWERSNGSPWEERQWATAFLGTDGFRPDCSLLVMNGEASAAYLCCGVDTPEQPGGVQTEGGIWQIGVRRAYRRRGLAHALLAEVMRRFVALGLATAVLDVNLNNPTAKAAYEQIGFVVSEQYTVYRKTV